MESYSFFNIKIALYDRERKLLKKHNFSEEVKESEISKEEKWILLDLKQKGVLCETICGSIVYYQGTVMYNQIKDKL